MAPVLEVVDLHKRFGNNEVLKGIDFSTPPGQVISLIGSSGSGKSTLLRCINMLEIPEQGFVRIDGEEIAMETTHGVRRPADHRQLHRIRAELGMVFQSFNLWSHMTVLRNVMEAPVHVQRRPRDEVRAQALELLAKVGIAAKADAFPSELSGGQQQRAAIARALCINPKVMLFDEPTSALDPELEGEVLRVIEVLADEGRTMLLVTHNMKFARRVSDRVIFLHQGVIEEDGAVDGVFDAPTSPRLRQFLAASAH